jgi:hypothetical protein
VSKYLRCVTDISFHHVHFLLSPSYDLVVIICQLASSLLPNSLPSLHYISYDKGKVGSRIAHILFDNITSDSRSITNCFLPQKAHTVSDILHRLWKNDKATTDNHRNLSTHYCKNIPYEENPSHQRPVCTITHDLR